MSRFCVLQFHNDKTGKVFSQETSTLRCRGKPDNVVTLYGPSNAGEEATFVFTHADMDSTEEDTYGWNYKITAASVAKNPGLAGYRLLIIND